MSLFTEIADSNANGAGYVATDRELVAEGARLVCRRANALRVCRIDVVGPKWVTVSYVTKVGKAWAAKRGEPVPRTRTRVAREAIWSDGRGRFHEGAPSWWTEWRDRNAFAIGRSIDQLVGERRVK